MRIRFGYVAMSLKLENCSPSKTITVKNYERIEGEEARFGRLRRITAENLRNCMRLLFYNAAHQIHVFRLTSKLVPLVTHPLTEGWDYIADFKDELAKIGSIARKNVMRISSHPDHYTLINSPRPEVFTASLKDLEYHENLFCAMGLDDAEMVMHVGGLYASRELSIKRFKEGFQVLPAGVRRRLLLENDDKSFGPADVLNICQTLNIPMVLDVHHHRCLNNGEKLADLLPAVLDTWQGRLPKLHFSSPKSDENCRAHAGDIDLKDFCEFLLTAREINRDFDVMIEAKNKDEALFKLVKGLHGKKYIKVIGEAEVSID